MLVPSPFSDEELRQKVQHFQHRRAVNFFDSTKEHPPVSWLWQNVFRGGGKLNAICGTQKVGKSRLALWWIVSILEGLSLWDRRCDVAPKRVMIIAAEEGEDTVQYRLTRYCERLGVDPKALHDRIVIVQGHQMQLEIAAHRDRLLAQIFSLDIDLVLVDPFANVHGAEEKGSPEFKNVIDAFRDWTSNYKFDMVLIHHSMKNMENFDPNNMATWMRGSSTLPAILDDAVFLSRNGQVNANGGSLVFMYRNGRSAGDGKVWKIKDLGREDPDAPEKSDLGWEWYGDNELDES